MASVRQHTYESITCMNYRLCTKSSELCLDRSFFPLPLGEGWGEGLRLGKEAYPVGSVYVLLSKWMCLLTPPKKAYVAVRSKPLSSVPSQREGKENFLYKAGIIFHLS